jgi:hypothetical protein
MVIQDNIRKKGEEKVRLWKEDWCRFAREALNIRLDDQQDEILHSFQFNPKTSVKSGTARGKDYVAAACAMSFFCLTPKFNPKTKELVLNTKVALTAPTDRQVKKIMMPEISRMYYSALRNKVGIPGSLTTYGIRTVFDEWFLTGFKADEHNHEAWSGFHAPNVAFIVTEASGIAQGIWDAIEGNLQGNSRLLIVFNDNNGTGYAAQSQKKSEWAKFRLDSLTAPNVLQKKIIYPGQVDWNWVDVRVKDWCEIIQPSEFDEGEGDFFWENENGKFCYRPNDLFRVKVRGMAPKVSEDILVPQHWIDLAVDRYKNFDGKITDNLRLGFDVAGMGRDNSARCFRYGARVEDFKVSHAGGQANHMHVVGLVMTDLKANYDVSKDKYPQVFVDTVGEGAGSYSRLLELQKDDRILKNIPVHSVKAGAAAKKGDRPLKDRTGQYTFKNLGAYLYWSVREWLNPSNHTGAMLPPGPDYRGLTERKWRMRSDGSIELESKEDLKERIKKSPDEEDSLALTFFPVEDIKPKITTNKRSALSGFH